MHLLAAKPGQVDDGSEAVDLGQSPGDIVFLSAADTELALLAAAQRHRPEDAPSLRLASILQLGHNLSVDIYAEDIIAHAKLVIVRLLGGVDYWRYGVEEITRICAENAIPLAMLPGDDQPDPVLSAHSTLPAGDCHRLWQYLVHGGAGNAAAFLDFAAHLLGCGGSWREPVPVLNAGIYGAEDIEALRAGWRDGAPLAALVFYRALALAGNVAAVDALIAALKGQGMNVLPIFAQSLKEPVSAGIVSDLLRRNPPDIILNATSFAVSAPGAGRRQGPFDVADCPVLQVIFSASGEALWRQGKNGLGARDIAMNVSLPEVDGRILARAVSFKGEAERDERCQISLAGYVPVADRVGFTARLAAAWARLRHSPAGERRVALILANYPNRDGRLANGVGLDTPAGTVTVLRALAAAGYDTGAGPEDAAALMDVLRAGPTNAPGRRHGGIVMTAEDYRRQWQALPAEVRRAIEGQWGAFGADPFFDEDRGGFVLPLHRFGNVWIGIQPARGYNIDPVRTYHDPDLVPPHGYLAFYFYLRSRAGVQAVIHMGKHGNLEWLPGKAVALSAACLPEAVLGPLPHIYPFIVNDPGEGTQAKRRAAAVIVDHLTPPLARAETYGPLADLERLVDEYYDAAGVDPRRLAHLADEILSLARISGLGRDAGIGEDASAEDALSKIDNYLCELKELQIRDGLHVFGQAPEGEQLAGLLVALTRLPRHDGHGRNASLIRALAADLQLGEGFDPLDCVFADPWTGPRPPVLGDLPCGAWRSHGDTVERLEILALELAAGRRRPEDGWGQSRAVLGYIDDELRPLLQSCGEREIAGLLRALEGRFLEPGPSGAPSRARPDVLPTGRNFYSVDSRTVPTPAAWALGWKSASLLLERHRQEHGDWPRALALSAWGTANMRTGGDDIAQAMALIGVRPQWDQGSGRVNGFEILPPDILDRPRIDVTLRISGFFRDAFPAQIDLFDSAVRALARLDEPEEINPIAARIRREARELAASGMEAAQAERLAGSRVFGSKPGAYGAGLQAMIDEGGWQDDADLAGVYLAWGGYAYGGGQQGRPAHKQFSRRLGEAEAVVQNQDNREHDILDSDDYYQFEGGMAAAVRHLSGRQPAIYHNDHSRPERPRIATLREEVGRIVRARAANPKWIRAAMRHGYKGAFEMAATVDYLFAFAATARVVEDHHFDLLFDAYLGDAAVERFLREHNPDARREMAEKFNEALERGLWRPRLNHARAIIDEIRGETA